MRSRTRDEHLFGPGPKRILTLDGGGIRGIIPAMILAVIEQRTNQPAAALFDYS